MGGHHPRGHTRHPCVVGQHQIDATRGVRLVPHGHRSPNVFAHPGMGNADGLGWRFIANVKLRLALVVVGQAPLGVAEEVRQGESHSPVFRLPCSRHGGGLSLREVEAPLVPFSLRFKQMPENNLHPLGLQWQGVLRHGDKGRGFGLHLQRPRIPYFCIAKSHDMGNTTPTPTLPYIL